MGPRLKLCRLIVALEALALRGSGDLQAVAGAEGLDRDRLADRQVGGLVAELDEMTVRGRVGLLEMAELGLGQDLLLAGAERELDGVVAVAVLAPDRR